MKNFFGFDSKNKIVYRSEFVVRDLDSAEHSNRLEEVLQSNVTARKNASFPAWFVLLACFFNFVGLILLSLGLPNKKTGFTQTHLIMLIVGGVLLVFGMTVITVNFIRLKRLKSNPYYQQLLTEEERLINEALKVPPNAEKIDFLLLNSPSKFAAYNFQPMKVFKENGLICFSDDYEVTGIPLSQVLTAYAVNAKTRFYSMEQLSKEKCDRCNIKRSFNYKGQYIINSRLVVEVQLKGEQYEIVVAGYDAEAFTKLLDKTAIIM